MLSTLGWRSLEQRPADAPLILFYRYMYFMALSRYHCPHTCISAIQLEPLKPCNPCTLFKFPPLPVTTNTLYSFFPLAVVQWNHLPSRAVVCSDRGTFRSVIIALQYSIAQTMKYWFLPSFNLFLTLVLLNKFRCHALYKFSVNPDC